MPVPSNFQGDTRIAQRSHFPHLSHEEIIKNARCQVQIGIFIPDVNIQLPIMPPPTPVRFYLSALFSELPPPTP